MGEFYMIKTLLLFSVLLFGCGTNARYTDHESPLPIVERVDTREFIGISFGDTSVINFMRRKIIAALPKEIGFCFYGYAKDTSIVSVNVFTGVAAPRPSKIAIIDSVAVARIDSTTNFGIWYTDRVACLPHRRLVGAGHTHPDTRANKPCVHSYSDVLYLQERGLYHWFSLVICRTTRSVLWQDGRTTY